MKFQCIFFSTNINFIDIDSKIKKKLTSFPAVIIPKHSPSENITEDDQSRPSKTAISVTVRVSASIINNSLCFLGVYLKYSVFCKKKKKKKQC